MPAARKCPVDVIDRENTTIKSQQNSCLNKTDIMTIQVDMSTWTGEIPYFLILEEKLQVVNGC